MVKPTMNPSSALAGHCMLDYYGYIDVLPPLNGTGTFPDRRWNSPPKDPIKFTQGGEFKLCWSEQGKFGIGDGWIIPFPNYILRVFGAIDDCSMYSWCLASRRFFCMQIHAYYTHYRPTGTQCQVFVQKAYGPLLYSRLTWQEGSTCQTLPGRNMIYGENYVKGPNEAWVRLVDPLDLIQLGHSRRDLTYGFHYRLCYCPGFDSASDGVCGEYEDFVQQVGHLAGLVASYLNTSGTAAGTAVMQIITMTRFTIKIDCGNGPYCDTDGLERIKLVPRNWNPYRDTDIDGVFWNMSTKCPEKLEVNAWHSPTNCFNGSTKQAHNCTLSGGTLPSEKYFGTSETRILPLYENDRPVAQISSSASFIKKAFLHLHMIPRQLLRCRVIRRDFGKLPS
jgi:hypothetical protein